MTKTELMETYTAEQLAEMVVSKQNIIDDMKSNIDYLDGNLERAKNTINQIDDILEKLFGVRHDTVDKPDEFEKILTEKEKGNVIDFLPTEPIKVADILIHNYKQGLYPVYAKDNNGQIQNIEVDGKIYPLETGEYEEYSELRQIAEYLLVYCNHNGEAEE